MGLAHGGQRQKNLNFYEESLNIPLTFSNTKLYPTSVETDALECHVDFSLTLASLLEAPSTARSPWLGVDYSMIVLDPTAQPIQDYIVFTFDDYQSGQKGPHPIPPNHIRSLREPRNKLAKNHDIHGLIPCEWEIFDLLKDPVEKSNLTERLHCRPPKQQAEFVRLRARLKKIQETRLQPLS